MDAREAILSRRSIRKFTDQEVEREKIEALAEAADSGPSACNKRPLKFYIITDRGVLSELSASGKFTKIDSPLAIVVAGDMTKTLPRSFGEYWIHDAAAASQNILLMARALGLGSCWCGVYLQKGLMSEVSRILGLEENIVPFSLIKIGYPAEEHEPHGGYSGERVKFI